MCVLAARLDLDVLMSHSAPALPIIASQFEALDELAWISSSYFLTQATFSASDF